MSQLIKDKKRNLVRRQDEHEEVCLDDLTNELVNIGVELHKLEFFNNKASATRVNSLMRKHIKTTNAFYKRMKVMKFEIDKM